MPPPKKSAFDDDEDSGGIYSFAGAKEKKEGEEEDKPEINYAPDLSIKDLRGPAQEAIVKPSNLIMLIGGLSALSNLFLICWSFWPIIFSPCVVDFYKALNDYYTAKQDMSEQERKSAIQNVNSYKEFSQLKDKDLEIVQAADKKAIKDFWVGGFPPMGRLWMMGIFIILLIYNAFAVIGAVKAQNLESRRWGIASSILMLLPMGAGGLSCLGVLGINFMEQMTGFFGEITQFYSIVFAAIPYLAGLYVGVMSLQVLLSQKFIDGFEYVAE